MLKPFCLLPRTRVRIYEIVSRLFISLVSQNTNLLSNVIWNWAKNICRGIFSRHITFKTQMYNVREKCPQIKDWSIGRLLSAHRPFLSVLRMRDFFQFLKVRFFFSNKTFFLIVRIELFSYHVCDNANRWREKMVYNCE